MKKIFFLWITFLLISCSNVLISCSKDDNEETIVGETPTTPAGGKTEESATNRTIYIKTAEGGSGQSVLTMAEKLITDATPVDKTDTYTFNNGRLTKHATQQVYHPEFSMTYERELDYTEKEVTVSDNNGNVLVYTLNEEGYAVQCRHQMGSQIRFYSFQYSDDHYLTRMEERIGNTFFSSLDLSYNNGELTSVTTFLHDTSNTIRYEPGETMNTHQLPCISLSETYPISTHIEAMYAKILGKMSPHLVNKTQPEGNQDEWTDYQYSVNEAGNISSIRLTTHYKGIVYP